MDVQLQSPRLTDKWLQLGILGLIFLGIAIIGFKRASTPSAKDAEIFLAAKIKKDSENLIRLISLKKTDGQSSVVNGVKTYRLNFEATMEFQDQCMWGIFNGSKWMGYFEAYRSRGNEWGNMEKRWGRQRDTVRFRGVVQFQKTERGWQGAFDRNTAEIL